MPDALQGWLWKTVIKKILPETWTKCPIPLEGKRAKVQIYTVPGTVADTLVWLVRDLERLRVKNWYDRAEEERRGWNSWIEWRLWRYLWLKGMITRDHTAGKASKSKVDKLNHLVAVVNFFPESPCCPHHGAMYRVAIVAELVTTTGISPHSNYAEDRRCEHLPCHQQRATLSPGKGSNPLGTSHHLILLNSFHLGGGNALTSWE